VRKGGLAGRPDRRDNVLRHFRRRRRQRFRERIQAASAAGIRGDGRAEPVARDATTTTDLMAKGLTEIWPQAGLDARIEQIGLHVGAESMLPT